MAPVDSQIRDSQLFPEDSQLFPEAGLKKVIYYLQAYAKLSNLTPSSTLKWSTISAHIQNGLQVTLFIHF